ncbi:MAG: DUF935 family protein [Chthoniobacteraceae bacterium]
MPRRVIEQHVGDRHLRIRETDPGTGAATATLIEPDETRYLQHRGHLLSLPDWRGGPLRSLVMWWLLGMMGRDWWARFLDKYGSPFLIGRYEQSDDASRAVLERAFQWATRIGGLVVSNQTSVEAINAAGSTANSDGFRMWTEFCNDEISKLVVGQTSSASTKAMGLGGEGQAMVHERVRDDFRAWDALRLGDTLRTGLFQQYLRINQLPGRAPKAVWGSDLPQAQAATGALLVALKNAGLEVADEAIPVLGERLGFPLRRGGI